MIGYTGWAIPEGNVVQIADASGRVIWAVPAAGKPVILEVEKITSDTYAGETTYTGEQFILLDIYPKTNGTVKVTYGGLTKTITDTSGAAEPNAQQVFFGTFNGVSDSVTTPASGTLTIEGGCKGFAVGTYKTYNSTTSKSTSKYCSCITAVTDWGGVTQIPGYAFYKCSTTTFAELPEGITSIGNYAFYTCAELDFRELPSGITSIGNYAFSHCKALALTSLPEGVVSIGNYAFAMGKTDKGFPDTAMDGVHFTLPSTVQSIGDSAFAGTYADTSDYAYCYFSEVTILATVPPTITTSFGTGGTCPIVVLAGYGETYKTAEGWNEYADRIVEAS